MALFPILKYQRDVGVFIDERKLDPKFCDPACWYVPALPMWRFGQCAMVKNAGAREVFIVEEPIAAAFIKLPTITSRQFYCTSVVVRHIAVISLGGIVKVKNLCVAGDHLNHDIISYVRDEFKILLGEKTAEEVKLAIGSPGMRAALEALCASRLGYRFAERSGVDRFRY